MTFCLGMKVQDGLVGVADTRITSGTEYTTARKLSIHEKNGRSLFIMTSGLRSVRDKAVTYFEEVIDESWDSFDKLYKAINAFAVQVRRVSEEDKAWLMESHLKFNLNALVGGQLAKDSEPKLFMLYPEGNWVEVSEATPYFIIGSAAYGKPLLDRALRYDSRMDVALKAGYLAFNATRKSSSDVGYPLDVVVFSNHASAMRVHRYQEDDLRTVSRWWQKYMEEGVEKLPAEWIDAIMGTAAPVGNPG